MATLPTRIQAQASAITTSTLIHIVVTGDTSQSPQGSSYKATLGQLTSLFGGNTDLYITGGTYSAGTLTLTNLTGGTITIGGFYTDQDDVYVTGSTLTIADNNTNTQSSQLIYHGTPIGGPYFIDTENTFITGGTYDNNTTLITFTKNDGSTFTVDLSSIDVNDTYVTGGTNNQATDNTNLASIDLLYNQDVLPGTYNLPYSNTFLTGGTYDNNTTLITFTKNDGTNFTVDLSSIDVNNTFVTGFTYDNVNTFTVSRNDGVNLGTTISTLSGVTYYGDGVGLINIPISGVTNLQGVLNTKISGATNLSSEGLFAQINGFDLEFKGLTSTGSTLNITSDGNTVNLETILPQDVFVYSGNANVSNSTLTFLNTTGGTFTVTNSAALFADNDINVTGGTYNSTTGCVTFTTNSGTTFDVCGFLTGFTDTNFANADLTFNGDRNHNTNGNYLAITTDNGLYNEGWIYLDNALSANNGSWIGYGNNSIRSYNQGNEIFSSNGITANIVEFFSGGTTFNTNTVPGVYFNVQTNSDTNSLYVNGTSGNVGVGTATPAEKLEVSGTSLFKTSLLTTGITPSFYFLDGVTTPTETTAVKSIYKEFRPTTTSSSIVVGDVSVLYPNVTSPTSAEFYSKGNLILYTGDLSLLNNPEVLTSEANVVQIQSNTGTYNGFIKSSTSVLRNLTAGGTIDKYIGFWMNGFDSDLTHNGTTNNLYGFYMDDQSGKPGNIPPPTNRWGVYIKDEGYNYIAGSLGVGTTTPTEKLEVSGKTKTANFQMTSGATNGYVLTSDASGNASWQTSSGGVSIDPYNNLGNVNTITWSVSGVSTNYQATLTGNTTLALTNVRNGDYGTIIVQQDGVGGRTLTFGTVNGGATTHRVANGGGGVPVLTSNPGAIDILTFTYNGSVMFWTVGNDYT
jgi:hypothetical protein